MVYDKCVFVCAALYFNEKQKIMYIQKGNESYVLQHSDHAHHLARY